MIDLKNVSFSYDNGQNTIHAIKNMTLHIDDGEFVFVVGASGAGKSSLLKVLLRENVADEGEVTVNGFDLTHIKRRKLPQFRRSIGVVFQDFRLIPNMTVYDNIAFSLRVTNASARFIKSRVPYTLELVGLSNRAKNYPAELSGGEQQRVALARALANNPSLLIADEPTGNVDPEMSLEIIELFRHINLSGTTVLVVTHQHDLVRYFGGRTISIEAGHIVFDGLLEGEGVHHAGQ